MTSNIVLRKMEECENALKDFLLYISTIPDESLQLQVVNLQLQSIQRGHRVLKEEIDAIKKRSGR